MNVNFKGNYVSKRLVTGKTSIYTFVKFVDDKEQEIELQIQQGSETPNFVRFAPYSVVADVQQGRYPRTFLVSFTPIKA